MGANVETIGGVQLLGGSITGAGGTVSSPGVFTVQSGSVSVRLAGAAVLNKTTAGTVLLAAPNTYTGLTTVNAGALELQATGGNAIAADVTVNGGSLRLRASDQIADTSLVSVISGGTFDLGAFSETVGGVQLSGGTILPAHRHPH